MPCLWPIHIVFHMLPASWPGISAADKCRRHSAASYSPETRLLRAVALCSERDAAVAHAKQALASAPSSKDRVLTLQARCRVVSQHLKYIGP